MANSCTVFAPCAERALGNHDGEEAAGASIQGDRGGGRLDRPVHGDREVHGITAPRALESAGDLHRWGLRVELDPAEPAVGVVEIGAERAGRQRRPARDGGALEFAVRPDPERTAGATEQLQLQLQRLGGPAAERFRGQRNARAVARDQHGRTRDLSRRRPEHRPSLDPPAGTQSRDPRDRRAGCRGCGRADDRSAPRAGRQLHEERLQGDVADVLAVHVAAIWPGRPKLSPWSAVTTISERS